MNPKGGTPPVEGQFPKGTSGNPGGRTPTKWLRELLDAAHDKGPNSKTHREAIGLHLIEIATSYEVIMKGRENPIPLADAHDSIEAARLVLAYDMGKPVEPVELTGAEGGPIQTSDGRDPASMNSEQVGQEIAGLLARARGADQAKEPSPGEPKEG